LNNRRYRLENLIVVVNNRHHVVVFARLCVDVGLLITQCPDHILCLVYMGRRYGPFASDKGMHITSCRLVMLIELWSDSWLLHHNEGGFTAVTGVGVEYDLQGWPQSTGIVRIKINVDG
jgi:hypothetical protein